MRPISAGVWCTGGGPFPPRPGALVRAVLRLPGFRRLLTGLVASTAAESMLGLGGPVPAPPAPDRRQPVGHRRPDATAAGHWGGTPLDPSPSPLRCKDWSSMSSRLPARRRGRSRADRQATAAPAGSAGWRGTVHRDRNADRGGCRGHQFRARGDRDRYGSVRTGRCRSHCDDSPPRSQACGTCSRRGSCGRWCWASLPLCQCSDSLRRSSSRTSIRGCTGPRRSSRCSTVMAAGGIAGALVAPSVVRRFGELGGAGLGILVVAAGNFAFASPPAARSHRAAVVGLGACHWPWYRCTRCCNGVHRRRSWAGRRRRSSRKPADSRHRIGRGAGRAGRLPTDVHVHRCGGHGC